MPRVAPPVLVMLLAPSLVCADRGESPPATRDSAATVRAGAPAEIATPTEPVVPIFQGAHSPLPDAVAEAMEEHSWREGCPVPLNRLSYLTVSHWGFDGASHRGELVVNAALAAEVVEIFRELFEEKFPIEKMKLIDAYEGSDDRSMADNNTSAFNCRWVAGRRGVFSKHSHGRAIDINPMINPYITKRTIAPAGGEQYADRSKPATGIVVAGDAVVTAFTSRGWTWGGNWRGIKDYQHFEKKQKN